jgi:threonine/homoserine/homoserine lactone efflux protein
MPLSFFVTGLLIGFSVGAPVGPVGALCIRRALADGWRVGLVAGLGAATADAMYGCVAGFGLTTISDFLVGQKFWLGLVGGTVLCALGVRTFLSRPPAEAEATGRSSLLGAYVSTVLLTLSNPAILLVFIALFSGFGLDARDSYWDAGKLVVGVFLGSASWWVLFNGGMALWQSRPSARWVLAVNRFAGAIILAFGVYAVSKSLLPLTGGPHGPGDHSLPLQIADPSVDGIPAASLQLDD